MTMVAILKVEAKFKVDLDNYEPGTTAEEALNIEIGNANEDPGEFISMLDYRDITLSLEYEK